MRFRRVLGIQGGSKSSPLGDVEPTTDEGRSPLASLLPPLTMVAIASGLALTWRRRQRLLAPEGAREQLRELERALPRLGWEVPPGVTLLQIERDVGGLAGPNVAAYVAGLRANRFGPHRRRRPGPGERRALRRALARGRGPRARLRALLAIPPGGPGRERAEKHDR